jgi:hypothetical protein
MASPLVTLIALLVSGALLFAVPIKVAAHLVRTGRRSYGACFAAALLLLGLGLLTRFPLPLRWLGPLAWLLLSGFVFALILRGGLLRGYLVALLQLPIIAVMVAAVLTAPRFHISVNGSDDPLAVLGFPQHKQGNAADFDPVLRQQLVGSWTLAPDSPDYAPVPVREVFKADGSYITYFYDNPDCAHVVKEIDATWTIQHGILTSRVTAVSAPDNIQVGNTSRDQILSVGDKELVLRSLDDGTRYSRKRSEGCWAKEEGAT